MNGDSSGEGMPVAGETGGKGMRHRPATVPYRSWSRSVVVVILLGAASLPAAYAVDLTVAAGRSNHSKLVLRVGAQFEFGKRWLESGTGHLSGYWDTGYTYWDGASGTRNHSISVSPVLVYEFKAERIRPYVEAGIGIAFFAHTRMHGYSLSSSFQFEDRLGLGLRFDGHELGLRALHYSNANIKRPNDGAETYTIHYRRSF